MLSAKTYFQISGLVFAIVGLAHLFRLLTGTAVVIGTWEVPVWASVLGVIAAWCLAYSAFKLSGKKPRK